MVNERIFLYFEPGMFGEHRDIYVSESEIIAEFYPGWEKRMRDLGRDERISHENCIKDFCTITWAVEQN